MEWLKKKKNHVIRAPENQKTSALYNKRGIMSSSNQIKQT